MRAARDKKPGFDFDFNGTALKIKLRGEIDHHSAISVRSSMDELIRRRRPCEVIIDMSGVDFMDSSGLGLIMGRYATVKEIGGEICVTDPSPRIEKIMNLAGMERIIKIKHSNEKAHSGSHKQSEIIKETNTARHHSKAISGIDNGKETKKGDIQ